MAIRKQQLRHRVANAGNVNSQAMGSYHPVGTAATPMVMPLAVVEVVPSPGGYGSPDFYQVNEAFGDPAGGTSGLRYQDVTTMWGPFGEPIPATVPGSWGQLRAAGRRV